MPAYDTIECQTIGPDYRGKITHQGPNLEQLGAIKAVFSSLLLRKKSMSSDEKTLLKFMLGNIHLDSDLFEALAQIAAEVMDEITVPLSLTYEQMRSPAGEKVVGIPALTPPSDMPLSMLAVMGFSGLVDQLWYADSDWRHASKPKAGDNLFTESWLHPSHADMTYGRIAQAVDWGCIREYSQAPIAISCMATVHDRSEFSMRCFLVQVAELMDPEWQVLMKQLSPTHYKPAPPKTIERSYVKETTDYLHLPAPRVQWVKDWVRCSFTFVDLEELFSFYEKLLDNHKVVSVKNGYSSWGTVRMPRSPSTTAVWTFWWSGIPPLAHS
jgi:hypothetical protein